MRAMAVFLVLLAGCASNGPNGGEVAPAQGTWHGAAYEDVVRSWGAPARSTKLPDGRDAHTWVSETIVSRGSFWPSLGIFGGSGGVGFGTGVTVAPGAGGELQRCERTLFLRDGRVVDQTWQGPSDYCASFRR